MAAVFLPAGQGGGEADCRLRESRELSEAAVVGVTSGPQCGSWSRSQPCSPTPSVLETLPLLQKVKRVSCGHDVEDSEGNSTLMEGTVNFGKSKCCFQDLRKRNSVGRIQCQKLSNTVSLLWGVLCIFQ